MIRELVVYERSSCRCGPCSAVCTSGQPGALAPSDLDHIAEFFGDQDPSEEFMIQNFVATEAVLDGESTRVIQPATRSDGRCVFLQEDGNCSCHPVAPFECSRSLVCDPEQSAPAIQALRQAINRSLEYRETWKWLSRQKETKCIRT